MEVMDISIHAPARGATMRQTVKRLQLGYFNPRTHGECDMARKH